MLFAFHTNPSTKQMWPVDLPFATLKIWPDLNSTFFQPLTQASDPFSNIFVKWPFTSVETIPVMITHQLLKLPKFFVDYNSDTSLSYAFG